MPIKYKTGDMFNEQSEAIVNTVNCAGVMGKGVALEFKRRWPDNFNKYKKLCKSKNLVPGMMYIFDRGDLFNESTPRYLINFPTKNHWREKSKLTYIYDGLDDFVKQLKIYNIKSVTLPPLGCGNGGLQWAEVKGAIEEKLSHIDGIDFYVYAPKESLPNPEYKTSIHKMTTERAILIKTIGELEKYFGGYLTRISMQKIVYFLQTMGLNYRVAFEKNDHGPYSEELKHAFKGMEEQGFIAGFIKNEEIKVTPSSFAEADEYLVGKEGEFAQSIINRLALLIEGYESPYGMELLSSVHYLVDHEKIAPIERVVSAIQSWNDHKNNKFSPDAIIGAHARLKEDGFLK